MGFPFLFSCRPDPLVCEWRGQRWRWSSGGHSWWKPTTQQPSRHPHLRYWDWWVITWNKNVFCWWGELEKDGVNRLHYSIYWRHVLQVLDLNVVGLATADKELLKSMAEQTLNDNSYGYVKVFFSLNNTIRFDRLIFKYIRSNHHRFYCGFILGRKIRGAYRPCFYLPTWSNGDILRRFQHTHNRHPHVHNAL